MELDERSTFDRADALLDNLVAMFGVGTPEQDVLRAALESVAPEDVAAILSDFEEDEKLAIFRALATTEVQVVVLEETDQKSHREILEALSELERRRVIQEMPVDDRVDLLGEVSDDEKDRYIATLSREEAQEVEQLLAYDPDTAGGIMTTEFNTIPVGSTSRSALALIQGNLHAESYNYLYVTRGDGLLAGVVSIREILSAAPESVVDEYMKPLEEVETVHVDTDREEVASVVERFKKPAVPVVDGSGRLCGIVTFDDAIEAVREEHAEDMMRLAGTISTHPFFEPVRVDFAKRLPFLLVTMVGGFGVALVQEVFKHELIGWVIFASMAPWIHLVSALSAETSRSSRRPSWCAVSRPETFARSDSVEPSSVS